MTTSHEYLRAEYGKALAAFVDAPDESGRLRAYDLGRLAVEAGLGLIDLAAIHRAAVAELVAEHLSAARVMASVEFFTESLSTFEMAQSGYREVQERAAIEHEIALTLQRSLLPAVPPVAGLELAVRYLPAGPHVEAGGDWYDVVPVGESEVGLVVGDVMGHGIQQAAVMGQMRLGLRAYLLGEYPIDEVVHRTDLLLQSLGAMHTATLVLAVVDLEGPALRVVNAGHPAPVLVGPEGGARLVTGGHGRLLGIQDASDRPVGGPLAVAAGSSLLLYTDGLLEPRERAGDDGVAVLRDTVDGFAGSPDDLCDLVIEAMVKDEPGDDICLLAAGVAGSGTG